MGWQAVQDHHVLLGAGEQGGRHFEAGEGLQPGRLLGFLPHAGEHVRADHVRPFGGALRLAHDAHAPSAAPRPLELAGVRVVARGARQRQLQLQETRGLEPGVCHVVAVPDPGERQLLEARFHAPYRLQVGEQLHGVAVVCQRVEHRHAAVLAELQQASMFEGSQRDGMHHP